jgi:hypothetical protein
MKIINHQNTTKLLLLTLLFIGVCSLGTVHAATPASAGSSNPGVCYEDAAKCKVQTCSNKTSFKCPVTGKTSADVCGGGRNATAVSINIGCTGKGSPIADALFALIRFLSIGVGIVIVASTVWAGIQYAMARDDPQAIAKAKARIVSNLEALLIYIFAYAILDYVLPGQFLK